MTPPEKKEEAAPPPTEKKDGESLLNEGEKKPETKPGAPEKYEPFTVPEGYTLDEKVATEAGTLFKELGLSQASGQKLIDMYVSKTTEAANAPYEAYKELRSEWQTAAKADPEIGGKLPEVKATVSKAIDSLGDAKLATEFREAMDLTGAGDHPAFIKAFYKLAQRAVEGKGVQGGGPSKFGQQAPGTGPRSAAAAMYPNLQE